MSVVEDRPFQQRMQRIEALIQQIERFKDPAAQDVAREVVQSLLDLHGAGLAKMFDFLAREGDAGRARIDALADDPLIGNLLLLHGLHPLDLETRIRAALDKVRPFVLSHGGDVELLGTDDGVVRLRLRVSGDGRASSSQTLKTAVEAAIYEAAPDLAALDVDAPPDPAARPAATFVPVNELRLLDREPVGKGCE